MKLKTQIKAGGETHFKAGKLLKEVLKQPLETS